MYTLEDTYTMKCAVNCQTEEEVLAFLDAVRQNYPPGFKDYWIADANGGEDFVPEAPTAITTAIDVWDDELNFEWCDAEWYADHDYTVIEFEDLDLNPTPRELVSEGFESLFNLEVL